MNKISCETELSVPFFDVDAMDIVWHGHYVKYMELARCDLLDQIKYNYSQMKASGYAWPVVDMRIKYVKPLSFKQIIIIKSTIVEYDYGLKIVFVFIDKQTKQVLTKAHTKQVAIDIVTGDMCLVSPDALLSRINSYE